MTETYHRCSRCHQLKPRSAFWTKHKDRYTPNGALHERGGRPQAYCKPCNNAHRAQRVAAQRERGYRQLHPRRNRPRKLGHRQTTY